MRLGLNVKTNKRIPMINVAICELSDGTRLTIDRDTTEYSSEIMNDGTYEQRMLWKGCYVWDGEDETYLTKGFPAGITLKLVELELEDDADEDYYVEVEDWFYSFEDIEGYVNDPSLLLPL